MPIYLVRWPGFHVSLVRARNEDELVDLLDDVAEPGGCRWTAYEGPLRIDLEPSQRSLSEERVRVLRQILPQ